MESYSRYNTTTTTPYSFRRKRFDDHEKTYQTYREPEYKYDEYNNELTHHVDNQYKMLKKSREMADECQEQLTGRASGATGWTKLRNYWLGEVGNELLRWQYLSKGYVDYHRMLQNTKGKLNEAQNNLDYAENELARQHNDHNATIEDLHRNYDRKLNDIENQWTNTLKQKESNHERDLSDMERNLRDLKDERMRLDDKLRLTTSDMQREMEDMDNRYKNELEKRDRNHGEEIGRFQTETERLNTHLDGAQRELHERNKDHERDIERALETEKNLKNELDYAQGQMDEMENTHKANMRHKDDHHKEEKRKIYEENRMTLTMLEDELSSNAISARGWKKVREHYMRMINKEMGSWVGIRNAIVHVSGDLRRKLRLQERDLADAVDELAYTQNEFDEKMKIAQREAEQERNESMRAIRDLERELNDARSQTNKFERDIQNLETKNNEATRGANEYLRRLREHERDYEKRMAELDELQRHNEGLTNQLADTERELRAREHENSDKERELQTLASENENHRRKMRDQEDELDRRERQARDEAKRVKVYEDMLFEKEQEVDHFRKREGQMEKEFLTQLQTHEREQGELNDTLGVLHDEAILEKERRDRFRRQSQIGFTNSKRY